jgi:hypothetical protein
VNETIEILQVQRDGLKRKLDAQNHRAIRPAALALLVLGLTLLTLWLGLEYISGNGDVTAMLDSASGMSMLLLLTGVAVIALSILLYFLSPARLLRAEIADAFALSHMANIERLLTSLMTEARGVYVPAARAGTTRLFIPVSGKADPASLPQSTGIFVTSGKGTGGIVLEPPGYRLLACLREIGATFTDKGLEDEMKDALKDSLELASHVAVRRKGDEVSVTMGDLANAGMCADIRKESPGTCTRTGCPVCSLVACMIAEGTGRMVRIQHADVNGRTLNVTFGLVQE